MRKQSPDTPATLRRNSVSFVLGVLIGLLAGHFVWGDPNPSATDAVARAMLRQSQNTAASLKREQKARQDGAEKTH